MRPSFNSLVFFAVTLMTAAGITGCRSRQSEYIYAAPKPLKDGLQLSTLAKEQMDTMPVVTLTKLILADSFPNIRSLLIARNNKLVYEYYFPGKAFLTGQDIEDFIKGGTDDLVYCASISMTVTGACIGIAIQLGFIKSIDEPIFTYFPSYANHFDTTKRKITIRHLLTMTSGLDWNEYVPEDNPENSLTQMNRSMDPIAFIISRHMKAPPGANYNYNRANAQLLEQIILKATGKKLDQFAQQYLFSPLGIQNYSWLHLRSGMVAGAWGLRLSPRDLVKLGILYMNNGKWNNTQILDSSFTTKAGSPQVARGGNDKTQQGYGYLLFTYQLSKDGILTDIAEAWGANNLTIFMCSRLHLLVVFTPATQSPKDYKNNYFTATGNYIFASIH